METLYIRKLKLSIYANETFYIRKWKHYIRKWKHYIRKWKPSIYANGNPLYTQIETFYIRKWKPSIYANGNPLYTQMETFYIRKWKLSDYLNIRKSQFSNTCANGNLIKD